MMASAGQGGAGLRGDQYYPPPPPPPRFPPPFPSSLPRHPYVLTPSFLLLPSTTIAVSTLQPSTFSPFYRRPSFSSSSFSTSLVLRIELLGRRDAPRLRSIPSYVCVRVCLRESAHGVCICGLEREGLFIVIGGTKRFVDRELCTMLFSVGFRRRCVCEWNARSIQRTLGWRISFFRTNGRILSIRFQFDRETYSFYWSGMWRELLGIAGGKENIRMIYFFLISRYIYVMIRKYVCTHRVPFLPSLLFLREK